MTLIQAVDLKKNNECCSISKKAKKVVDLLPLLWDPIFDSIRQHPAYFCTEYVEKNLEQFVGILTLT